MLDIAKETHGPIKTDATAQEYSDGTNPLPANVTFSIPDETSNAKSKTLLADTIDLPAQAGETMSDALTGQALVNAITNEALLASNELTRIAEKIATLEAASSQASTVLSMAYANAINSLHKGDIIKALKKESYADTVLRAIAQAQTEEQNSEYSKLKTKMDSLRILYDAKRERLHTLREILRSLTAQGGC